MLTLDGIMFQTLYLTVISNAVISGKSGEIRP